LKGSEFGNHRRLAGEGESIRELILSAVSWWEKLKQRRHSERRRKENLHAKGRSFAPGKGKRRSGSNQEQFRPSKKREI